jgi:hypothetical protein
MGADSRIVENDCARQFARHIEKYGRGGYADNAPHARFTEIPDLLTQPVTPGGP